MPPKGSSQGTFSKSINSLIDAYTSLSTNYGISDKELEKYVNAALDKVNSAASATNIAHTEDTYYANDGTVIKRRHISYVFVANKGHCTVSFISRIEVVKQQDVQQMIDFIAENIRISYSDIYGGKYSGPIDLTGKSKKDLLLILDDYSKFCEEEYLKCQG